MQVQKVSYNYSTKQASPKISFGDERQAVFKVSATGIRKVESLNDEQVAEINRNKKLPEGYYLVGQARVNVRGGSRGVQELTISKKIPTQIGYEENFYMTTLPEGYEVVNHKNKTYLKEKDVDLKKGLAKSKTNVYGLIFAGMVVFFSSIIVALAGKK